MNTPTLVLQAYEVKSLYELISCRILVKRIFKKDFFHTFFIFFFIHIFSENIPKSLVFWL
jgi:hypothetical protein